MAKKKSKSSALSAEDTPPPKGMEAFRLIIGLFFGAFAVYTFIALLSYLFTWAEDQSLLTNSDVWSTLVPAENGGGKIGFFWANLLLSRLFGLGAFIIPFFFLGIFLYALKIKKIRIVKLFFLSISGAIIFSVFFSYIFGFTKFETWFGNGVGGSYGYFVNEWLTTMLGNTGAGALLIVLLAVWLVILSKGFVKWFNRMVERIFHRKPKGVNSAVGGVVAGTAMDGTAAGAEPGDHVDLYKAPDSGNVDGEDVVFEILESSHLDSGMEDKSSAAEEEGNQENMNGSSVNGVETEDGTDDDFLKNIPAGTLETLFDPRLDLSGYQIPPLSLLDDYRDKIFKVPMEELEKNNRKIVKTLKDYKIDVDKISARTGPTVTLYEIVPAAGVRIAQIKRLEEDIARSLAANGVRIIAPIPGTNAVGIEVANEKPSIVPMRSMLEDPKFTGAKYELPVVLGRTISNEALTFDLAKVPHLLVAGATGQGKSVGLNAIITSLLYTKHPSELKFVLVDPKKVELSLYSKIERHFLAKLPDSEEAIITDTQKVVYTLKSLTIEMDNRYDLLKMAYVRNIKEYNEKFLSRRLNPNKGHRYLPFIVVVIDEFADLLMTAGREIEEPIARLAQLARAIGIHLVIATQRPTTNIITGLIKANFTARIAFRVISNIDSRTILDTTGANQLVGRGDMLISTNGELTRVQCAMIDTVEVERITEYIGAQRGYASAYYLPEYTGEEGDASGVGEVDLGKRDKLFDEAAKLVVQFQQGSTSLIQRRLNLGYNRAGRIMDQLEAAGIVGPFEGSKARQVLITDFNSLDRILSSLE
jgi:S-DNA-T family DNA segregation ATPase FtsK/SpoIIIE